MIKTYYPTNTTAAEQLTIPLQVKNLPGNKSEVNVTSQGYPIGYGLRALEFT
ncbi:unnamed protein product, partial [marine sediment metagenome]